jgi:hypothetical protein
MVRFRTLSYHDVLENIKAYQRLGVKGLPFRVEDVGEVTA